MKLEEKVAQAIREAHDRIRAGSAISVVLVAARKAAKIEPSPDAIELNGSAWANGYRDAVLDVLAAIRKLGDES